MSEEGDAGSITDWPTYGWSGPQKEKYFLSEMKRLTQLHRQACPAYDKIVGKIDFLSQDMISLETIPFIPVRLFKLQKLLSVSKEEIIKTMTSSGTSGQAVSQIFLDKQTSALQVKVLARIMADVIGSKRLPMLVIDCKATVSDRLRFSARTAGILGFSMFGRQVEYALDDDMTLNLERVEKFVSKHAGQPILVFGFTFMVWQHLVRTLEESGQKINLEGAILIHGGGWKKLISDAVDPQEYKERIKSVLNIKKVHNYYGMVEQTGSIFMECEYGHLHASAWSDVIIRDSRDFSVCKDGQTGLVQLLSVIPHSYPGHSILSEDIGRVLGRDDCPCQRKGTYFAIEGRLENAEIRGCSDTFNG
ncbi:MAG: acyl-protein synthetase [Methylocystaceae bacterium]|nr:acyl-protein synthetase [Methylocystaceae bacterium]